MSKGGWTAILLAGERPGETGFARQHGVAAKALIPIDGEPMLGRVARALLASEEVGRIVVLAQDPEALLAGPLAWMGEDPRIATSTGGDGISSSVRAVAGSAAAPFPVLVATADHALLTSQMVQAFLGEAGDGDVAFAVVGRNVIEAAYPETKRTWLRFADGDYSGANLFALQTSASAKALEIWASVERDRKKMLKLFWSFGPLLALRAISRTISLDAALDRVGRRVGLNVRAVRLPFAEAAIDVDKPADLILAERILRDRSR